jgi:spore maturation protein CgeB
MNLPDRYVKTPTIPLPTNLGKQPIRFEMISGLIPNKDIDLWIQVDANWHFSSRPKARTVVLVETDPHVIKHTYSLPKSYSDLTFCMQTPYIESDEIWLPYANDPAKFYRETVSEYEYDACLLGLNYSQRTMLVNRLRESGKKVAYGLGVIYDEYRQVYNSSQVALSWSSLLDTPVRVFEAMGMGRPLVANRTPDIMKLFVDGEDFLGFDTVEEAVSQVDRILGDPSLEAALSLSGHAKVASKHTWDHRIQEILDACKIGSNNV